MPMQPKLEFELFNELIFELTVSQNQHIIDSKKSELTSSPASQWVKLIKGNTIEKFQDPTGVQDISIHYDQI